MLCRLRDCKTCSLSPEFVLVHYDCYEIFRQKCALQGADALHRLWILAAWRDPWQGARPIFTSSGPVVDIARLQTMGRVCGLPHLHSLPMELLLMIQGYSRHALLWRSVSVLRLADHVSDTEPEPLLVTSLCKVSSWERGGKLELLKLPSPPPVVRLTIDSEGISKIERLSHAPEYSRCCYDHSAFIVENGASVSGFGVQFKVRAPSPRYSCALNLIQGQERPLTAPTPLRQAGARDLEHTGAARPVPLYT